MRERDERPSIVPKRQARKVTARGRECRLPKSLMNEAQPRAAIKEGTLADLIAPKDGHRIFGQIAFDDEWIDEVRSRRNGELFRGDAVAERAIDGQLHWNVPVGGATCTRVTAAIVGVGAQSEYERHFPHDSRFGNLLNRTCTSRRICEVLNLLNPMNLWHLPSLTELLQPSRVLPAIVLERFQRNILEEDTRRAWPQHCPFTGASIKKV